MPYSPPETQHLDNILPSEPLLLMGAGPVPISHAVARANGVVINHLGETMDEVISNVKIMGRYAFQTVSDKIIGVSGPASAAMEMAITNLLWPGRSILALSMGTFSGRMAEMAEGVGADVTVIESAGIQPVRVEEVQEAFSKKHFDVITMAQGETSCGVEMKCLPEVARIAKEHGALVVVDAVCTLTTMPMQMDEWGVDVAIAGGQKGLSSIPGVSLIAFSQDAWKKIKSRKERQPHWCLDALRAQTFWGSQQYHYTAPVPGILALYEALRQICEETLPMRFERHRVSSIALQAGIETMGLKLFVPIKDRLNSVVAINTPEATDSAQIRKTMSKRFNVEISGAFGLDILRIGQMGEQCRSHNLFKVLYALGMSCRQQGLDLDVSLGMAELERNLVIDPENLVD
ncbi:MAG: alanine--glyoxylate aminotransferase family protein [SAR324 cluster bacterium]|jgi:aspartate aminotransferase-like enzyme|uniref:Aminotransferase class V domain-containing protein n=1 Tax=marine metagenome TaxID=408172 RepID=A0A381PRA6_9ZZZZ|nr:alanine--glyoxylate aminotransferase family protein [SAR324 cluster bacterium]HBR59970.1 alanine--glyoxylate aminotransferase [Deltaproteobacteria bacterium]MDP6487538.1 alanine--glyoxylate aminotransferase family protein [SAR324 cluster bacterium]MDP7170080.1 alanine--glyoxylate aminotransferase family protein [SAR324 cluster bacterium]MDP7174901.1 alanine--glyoxylate aminotransferase family protein [SAR324 cluster bacterium]|tara:strand:- start:8250 stop:9458 length:1209 start_codon:yes stop_codon:yes gene_type:complete